MRLRLWSDVKRYLKPRTTRGLIGLVVVGGVVVLAVGGGVYAAIFGGFSGAGSNSTINLQKGLVGWWKLDGDGKDSSPYRNNGTLTSVSANTDRKGKTSGADSFNGTSSRVQIANSASVNVVGDITVGAWVYRTSSAAGTVINKDTQYSLYVNTGNTLSWADSSNWSYASFGSFGSVPTNTWVYLAATKQGSTVTIYMNGAVVISKTFGSPITSNSSALCIGAFGVACNTNFLAASVDDARVYERALSAAEITALYKQYDAQVNAGSGENGLLGWWKMDGNAFDSTPYRRNGTVTGAALTADRKGLSNSAYSFNGTSNYISAGSLVVPSAISASAWVKLSSSSNGMIVLEEPANTYWELMVEGTNLRWVTGAYNSTMSCPSVVTTGVWHHVAAVQSGTTVTLYIDGVSCKTGTQSVLSTGSTGTLTIGRYSGGYYWNGSLDDVRVYNRALSAQEVAAQASSYNSQINLNSSPTTQGTLNLNNGLVGYWNYNGNAVDSTPYRRNGTVTGATLVADRNARANSAYSFNGTSATFITMPTISVPTVISLSAWVYSTNFNQTGFIVSKTPVNSQWELFFEGTVLRWRVLVSGGISCANPSNSAWHHVVATQTGTTATLYIDGVQCATSASVTAINNGSGILEVGNYGGGYFFNGNIDDVRIYNRVLSAAEVTALYDNYY